MNHPSLAALGLLRARENIGIAVSPGWTCDHDVLVDWVLADLVGEDGEDEDGRFDIIFEPDFLLDDQDDSGASILFESDDEDDEEEDDGWPP